MQILALKFQEKPYIYKTIAYFLKNMQKSLEKLKKYDIIIIVPVSNKRKLERGYDQCELIAKEISKNFNIQYNEKCLLKNRNIQPQSLLTKEERIKNVENVYSVKNQEKIINKKILLIDDIYTTGSTVNECSRILKQAGGKNIGILTIAKD